MNINDKIHSNAIDVKTCNGNNNKFIGNASINVDTRAWQTAALLV